MNGQVGPANKMYRLVPGPWLNWDSHVEEYVMISMEF